MSDRQIAGAYPLSASVLSGRALICLHKKPCEIDNTDKTVCYPTFFKNLLIVLLQWLIIMITDCPVRKKSQEEILWEKRKNRMNSETRQMKS